MGRIEFPGCYIADPAKIIESNKDDFIEKTPWNASLYEFGRRIYMAPVKESFFDLDRQILMSEFGIDYDSIRPSTPSKRRRIINIGPYCFMRSINRMRYISKIKLEEG